MSLTDFLAYLEGKENRTYLEERVRQALHDDEFRKDYQELTFLIEEPNAMNVIRNPREFDRSNDEGRYAYFQRVLVVIINAHSAYLYDKKGKYSDLKKSISEVENRIVESNKDIERIQEMSKLISGQEFLEGYAKEFLERARKYGNDASGWQRKLYIGFTVLSMVTVGLFSLSTFNTGILSRYLADDIKYFYFSAVAIKIIILVGIIQVIRFFYRNYNANKHLESQALHKSDVLRSLVGVYKTIDPESKNIRDELIKTGALTAFQNGESGYITTKEGAGSGDAGLYAVISGILKK